jgi:hypothetical protein
VPVSGAPGGSSAPPPEVKKPEAKALEAPRLDAEAFTWMVEPTRIVLGDTQSVTVSLTARLPGGAPLDVAPPQVMTSAGAVGAPLRTGPGSWRIDWTPPKEAFPHVAVLVATLDTTTTTAVGFLPLRMSGKGNSTVQTKPKSVVTMRIEHETFGPVRADDSGVAVVPIVAPPGVTSAVARSTDEVGNQTEKPIALGVPPFNRLALIALDDVIAADGSDMARLLAVAVDERGAPLKNATLQVKTNVGEVKIASTPAPGLTELHLLPGKSRHADAEVEVALAGVPGSVSKATVQLVPGKPAAATISLSKDSLRADEDEREVVAHIELVDDAGRRVPPHAVGIAVDAGRLTSITREPDGTRRSVWLLPKGKREVPATITVHLSSGQVLGSAQVQLLPGAPARLTLEGPPRVVADGETPIELVVRVTDREGALLQPEGALLEIAAADGQLLESRLEDTALFARVLPAAVEERRNATLRASLGELSAETEVGLIPPPRVGLLLAAGLAASSNYQELVSAGPELSALVRLPIVDGSLHVGGSVGLLQSILRPRGIDDHRAIPIFGEVAWRPALSPTLDFHIGAATGVVVVDAVPSSQTAHDFETALAAQLVLGLAWPLGPGSLELMGRGGTAIYLGGDVGPGLVGLPLGAALVVAWRMPVL